MRYQPPYGSSDPNAPYINGDPSQGVQGSIPPAPAFEQPMRELVGVIEKSGLTPSDANLLQLTQGVRSQRLNYAIGTIGGTVNDIVCQFDPPITIYTLGLTLRVRVPTTNTGPARINAGAGAANIRRMNNADVGPGDLPVGAIVTLVFDGTAFQLSNYGAGLGGDVTYEAVNIPYTVDQSPAAGEIWARGFPGGEITAMNPGDVIAVRVAHTNVGATIMLIDNMAPIPLLPNGVVPGGIMLQSDLMADDVVQFFFDGVNLRFPAHPEITAPVTYRIGPGQQFPTWDNAMTQIRRKIIGANGFVTLQFIAGVFQGPIQISHPSADRLAVIGTMLSNPPVVTDFQRTGSSSAQRANDAQANIIMLRQRYGTEIRIPLRPPGLPFEAGQRFSGLQNVGPGAPLVADLLITGPQQPNVQPSGWDYDGVTVGFGSQLDCRNVTVWGSQIGFSNLGAMWCSWCFVCGGTMHGFWGSGSSGWFRRCGAFGNGSSGFETGFGTYWTDHSTSEVNATFGFVGTNGSSIQLYWSRSSANPTFGVYAYVGTTILIVTPSQYGTTSPPVNTTGPLNTVVATQAAPDPGPPIGSPMPPQPPPWTLSVQERRTLDFSPSAVQLVPPH